MAKREFTKEEEKSLMEARSNIIKLNKAKEDLSREIQRLEELSAKVCDEVLGKLGIVNENDYNNNYIYYDTARYLRYSPENSKLNEYVRK